MTTATNGQGVEAAALTAARSTTWPALADLDGAALLLQQGHGAAVADLARVEAAAPAVGQLQPVEGAALDHVAGAPLLQAGQGQAAASSGRGARSAAARPDSYCLHCGRRMSPGRHGRRRYCSNGCRQSAYKRRRRVEAAAVEGVTDGHRR